MKASKSRKKPLSERLYPSDEVLLSFKDAFPGVEITSITWSWESPYKIYQASFEHEGQEYEVEITVTGHFLLVEMAISPEDLPELVRKAMREHYPNQSIDEVERVEYSNGIVCYEIELEKGEKSREVLFREDGLFIGVEEDL
jgi:uncharacterized membrane protein YkoI